MQMQETRGLRAQLADAVQRLQATSALLTQREATLDAILAPGVQMFQLTASGDPDPLHPGLLGSASETRPSSTASS